MATEQGLVIKASGRKAIVKTRKTEACESCASKDSCGERGRDVDVEVLNPLGAREGDHVTLQMDTGHFLRATFFLYVFPVLCMIAGAFVGERIAFAHQGDPSGYAAGFGLGFFLVAILIVKIKGNAMGRQEAYRPRITRILK